MREKLSGRRDVVVIAAGCFLFAGAAVALWPLIDQMNPTGDRRPEELKVDLSPIAEGQTLEVVWLGKPVQVRHRTVEEIAVARAVALSDLRDTDARLSGIGAAVTASDQNRTKRDHPEWLVVVALCTRDGCKLAGARSSDMRGEYGGWICPCCASHFDTSGRVRAGIAPHNLAVPPYRFVDARSLVLPLVQADGRRMSLL